MTAQTTLHPALNILVVDDEPFVQAVTIHLLQQLGYQQIEKACDGADALRVMQNSISPFELVICDLDMPVMNGCEFLHAAQTMNYQGALIVLSGEAQQQLTAAVELGIACGLKMLGALRKPLDREALQDMLMRYGAASDQ